MDFGINVAMYRGRIWDSQARPFACFAGATRTFRGTVSFPIHKQVSVLKRIECDEKEDRGRGLRRSSEDQ